MLIQLHCDQAGRYKSSNILRAKFADYLNKFGSKKKSMMLSFNHYLNMTEGRNESDEA